jgi:hypothetical protein
MSFALSSALVFIFFLVLRIRLDRVPFEPTPEFSKLNSDAPNVFNLLLTKPLTISYVTQMYVYVLVRVLFVYVCMYVCMYVYN